LEHGLNGWVKVWKKAYSVIYGIEAIYEAIEGSDRTLNGI